MKANSLQADCQLPADPGPAELSAAAARATWLLRSAPHLVRGQQRGGHDRGVGIRQDGVASCGNAGKSRYARDVRVFRV